MRVSSSGRVVRFWVALCAFFALAGTAAAADYVALGDSYSSGVGTGSYTLSSPCYRSVYAYPWLLHLQKPSLSVDFVACSGAKTADLMANQLASVTSSTSIVTVTIGGNDIGYSNLIVQCTVGDCSAALDSTKSNLGAVLGPRLLSTYAAIKARSPAAKIVVLGYPRMFSGSSCFGALGISATERTKANQLAEAVDTLSRAKAADAGVTYVSALGQFVTHPVCSGSPWLNGLNLFNSTESYHPNRNGHNLGYAPLAGPFFG